MVYKYSLLHLFFIFSVASLKRLLVHVHKRLYSIVDQTVDRPEWERGGEMRDKGEREEGRKGAREGWRGADLFQ